MTHIPDSPCDTPDTGDVVADLALLAAAAVGGLALGRYTSKLLTERKDDKELER